VLIAPGISNIHFDMLSDTRLTFQHDITVQCDTSSQSSVRDNCNPATATGGPANEDSMTSQSPFTTFINLPSMRPSVRWTYSFPHIIRTSSGVGGWGLDSSIYGTTAGPQSGEIGINYADFAFVR
jgi:hypothetical protein